MPKGADCLEFYNPHYIILQLGIVDCAPRLLYPTEKVLVSKLPQYARKIYIKGIKKLRSRNKMNTVISKNAFETNLIMYLKRCSKLNVHKVIAIKIAVPDARMVSKNPEIVENVISFNSVYHNMTKEFDFLRVIDPLDSRKYDYSIFQDGYHPNQIGHELVFNSLAAVI